MLSFVTWQAYFAAIIFLSICWYAYVAIRYYRSVIFGLFGWQTGSSLVQPPVEGTPVMGPVKAEFQETILDPEDFFSGDSVPDDISDQTIPAGPEDELINETQLLVTAFAESGNKQEFLSLLALLLDKYEPYRDEIDLRVIRPLAAQLPFTIENKEWPKFEVQR